MEDSNVNPHSGAGAQSSGVTFSLVPYGAGQAIRMDLDSAWLHDGARVFPVTVDPTVTTAAVDADDTYVSSHDYPNTDNSGKHDLAVGTWNGGTEKSASYIHLSALTGSGFLQHKYINSAKLELWDYWSYSCNPRAVSIYRVTQSWSGSTTKTYPGPSYDSAHVLGTQTVAYGYTSCPSGNWVEFTLDPAQVTKWTHWLEPFYGITIRASLTDSYAWKRFASAQNEVPNNHPYLAVTYSNEGFSASLPSSVFNPPVTSGTSGGITVAVTNLGSTTWTPTNNYKLTFAVLNSSGTVVQTGPTYAMPKNVAPSQSANVPITVAPLPIGTGYTLRIDMVNPSGQSFHTTYATPYFVSPPFSVSNGVPQVAAYYPLNNGYVTSLNPTLWARYYDPDNTSTTHQFQFKVCNGTPAAPTNCQLSNTITSATWTPPTALTWGTQWFWYAKVSDTVTWSSWYGPYYFTPVVAQPEVTSHLAGAPDSADTPGLNPQVGNYTTSFTDASVSVAGPPLRISRSYNSQDLRTGEAFGSGWSSALDQSIVPDGDGSGSVVVTLASGTQVRFGLNADGSYSPPMGANLTLVATTSPAGWTLRDATGYQRLFNSAGQLTTIIDASGNQQTYGYTSGQVTTVTDQASGRALHITWSGPGGHVTAVAEDAPGVGQTAPAWTYSYTGGQLTQVCSPISVSSCIGYGYTASSYYQSVVQDDNPLAYWPLDETDGSAAVNAASTDDGALDGADQDVILGQPGAIGGSSGAAVGFNGTSDSFIALPDSLASSSMAFAVELWFKAASGAHGVLLGEQNKDVPTTPTHWTPMLYIGTDGKLRGQEWNGAATPITTSGTVTDGLWHHAVLSVAVSTQTLYLDGTVVGTLAGTVTHQDMESYMLGIGTGSTGWPASTATTTLFPFTGSIDEAAFYAHPLSQAQVLAHYNVHTAGSRLTTATEPGSFTATTLAYDGASGRVTSLTDRNGQTWNLAAPTNTAGTRSVVLSSSDTSPIGYTYDTANGGRLVSRTDGLGTTSYQYNASGFVSQVTDPNGNVTSYQTDARGNRIATTTCRTTPTCQTSYASYYLNTGNPLDPRNDVMLWSADARSSSVTDTTYRTTFTIDTAGRVTGTSYPIPAGQSAHPTTAATYSTAGAQPGGLLVSSTARNGGVTNNTYNAAGDLQTTTDPVGLTTTFTYDNLGRALTADRSATVAGNPVDYGTAITTYNPVDEVATLTAPPVTNTITSVTHTQVTTYSYDAMGRRTSQVVSDSTGGDPSRTTTWGYDPAGRLTSTTDPANNTTSQTWDAAGDVVTRTQPNGLVLSYTYNDRHQLEETDATGTGADPMNPTATTLVLESRAYDPGGRLASVTDAMGRETDYTYYGNNLEATTTVVTRDTNGNITASTQTASDAYDNAGHLTSHTAQGSIVTTTTYDPAGYTTGQTFDPSGLNRHIAYANNLDGTVASQTLTAPASPGRSEVTSFTYDPDGRQLTQTISNTSGSPANLTTTLVRDPRGLVTSQTDPAGIVTTSTYDTHDQKVTEVGADRTTWVNGVQTTGVTPTTTLGRDDFGEVTDQRDPAGAVIHGTFDADGRNTAITLPSYTPPNTGTPIVATSHTAYDAMSNIQSTTDALGRVTSYTYDPYGDVLTVTAPDPDGAGPKTAPVTANTYDRDWELLSSTDPTGGQTQATYNYLGQQATSSVSDRDSGPTVYFTISYGYNTAGQRTTVTDPLTNVTTTDYNTAGEPTKVTDPTGRFVQTTYDLAGRPTSQVRGKGSSWAKTIYTYGYDLAGRQTTEIDCTVTSTGTCQTAQRTITATYDGDGRQLQTTTGAGRLVINGYDGAGQLSTVTQRTDPANPATAISVQLGYDSLGHRTRMVDGNANATTYTFNPWGLPESTIEPSTPADPGASDRTWTTSYDAAGQSVYDSLPGGVSRTRTFNADGKLTDETGAGTVATTTPRHFDYDGNGRLSLESGPGGDTTFTYNDRGLLTHTTGPGITASFTYDADGNMLTRTDPTGTGTFTYNAAGMLQTVADPLTGVTATYTYGTATLQTVTYGTGGPTDNYTYDNLSRVASETWKNPAGTTLASATYGYDTDDNLTSKTTAGVAGAGANSYSYDGLDRLTGWTRPDTTVVSYGYDNASNRTTVTDPTGTRTTTYDARNRQIQATGAGLPTQTWTWKARGTLASTTGSTATTYTVDAFERTITASRGTGTTYAYDSLDRLVTSGTNTLLYDDQTNNAVQQPDGASATDLIFRDPGGTALSNKAGATAQALLTDKVHGDVTTAVNPTTGALTASTTYDPYGQKTATSGTLPLGYQGGLTDPTTGNIATASRWYDATTGSFTSRDTMLLPTATAASPNRYAYGTDNPLTNSDPGGHFNVGGTGIEIDESGMRAFGKITTGIFTVEGEIDGEVAPIPGLDAAVDVGTFVVGDVADIAVAQFEVQYTLVTSAWETFGNWFGGGGGNAPTQYNNVSNAARTLTNIVTNLALPDLGSGPQDDICMGVRLGCKRLPTPIPTDTCPPTCGPGRPPIPPCILLGLVHGLGDTICKIPWYLGTKPRPQADRNSRPTTQSLTQNGTIVNTDPGTDIVPQPESQGQDQPGPTSRNRQQDDCLSGNWTGSNIQYWDTDNLGRAMGAEACFTGPPTPAPWSTCNAPGLRDASGNLTDPNIRGGHLIAAVLGGNGSYRDASNGCANITPLWSTANIRMRDNAERDVRQRATAGQTVYYRVVPEYRGNDLIPYMLYFTVASTAGPVENYLMVNGRMVNGRYRVGP